MGTKKVLLLVAGLVLVVATLGIAARDKILDQAITADGAKDGVVELKFGAGNFTVTPSDMADFANVHCKYDPEDLDVDVDKQVKGSTIYLTLDSDFNNRRHHDHITNDWDVTLSTRYPMDLSLDVGAAKADLDLGGVPLREISADIGAASGTLDFSQPNPERLRELKVDAGASSLDLLHVGNANFEHFKFSGGAGSFDLDLRGKYQGESEVDIEIGVSSADIILPEGVPVRIESDNNKWFSSVDIHGGDVDEIEDGVWESPDYAKATTRVTIRVEVGMGSADFRWKA